MLPAPQNFRAMMMDQERRMLADATNAVQFLQSNKDGSRQGNLYLSSAPGATTFNGYNGTSSSLNQQAVYGSGPIGRYSVASA